MLIQNMAIKFQLQTENLTSINKHVIDEVRNKHKAVVRISKRKVVHLCCSQSL